MMGNKAELYFEQTEDLYNQDFKKHTVMLAFVDQKEDWTDKNIKKYRKKIRYSVKTNIVIASSDKLNLLTDYQELFFNRNWDAEVCDSSFIDKVKEKLCEHVKEWEM